MAERMYIKLVKVTAKVDSLGWKEFLEIAKPNEEISYFEEGKDFDKVVYFVNSKLGKISNITIRKVEARKLIPLDDFMKDLEPPRLIVEVLSDDLMDSISDTES